MISFCIFLALAVRIAFILGFFENCKPALIKIAEENKISMRKLGLVALFSFHIWDHVKLITALRVYDGY